MKKTGHRVTNPRNHVEFSDCLERQVTHYESTYEERSPSGQNVQSQVTLSG